MSSGASILVSFEETVGFDFANSWYPCLTQLSKTLRSMTKDGYKRCHFNCLALLETNAPQNDCGCSTMNRQKAFQPDLSRKQLAKHILWQIAHCKLTVYFDSLERPNLRAYSSTLLRYCSLRCSIAARACEGIMSLEVIFASATNRHFDNMYSRRGNLFGWSLLVYKHVHIFAVIKPVIAVRLPEWFRACSLPNLWWFASTLLLGRLWELFAADFEGRDAVGPVLVTDSSLKLNQLPRLLNSQ